MNSLAESNRLLSDVQSKYNSAHVLNESIQTELTATRKTKEDMADKLRKLKEEKDNLVAEMKREELKVSETVFFST